MSKKIQIKETLIYFISSVSISILGFIISILYSSMFEPSDYGVYSLVYSIYSLMSQIICGWIATSLIRNFHNYKEEKEQKKFYGTFFQFQLIASIVLIVIFNFIAYFTNFSKLAKKTFLIFTIIFFFENTLLIINTKLRAEQNAKQYSNNNILNSILKIIIILVLYYIIGYRQITVISISLLLSEVIQYIYLLRKLSLAKYYNIHLFSKDILISMLKYGIPLIGVGLTAWILNVSDRYIIQFYFSTVEVGLYSYAYSIGNNLFSLLIQFIMLGAYPNIVKTWEEFGKKQTIQKIKEYLRLYFIILIPASFGVIGIAKEFFSIFTDERYQSSYPTFIITCISIALLGLSQYTNKPWELTKKTKKILILNVIIAVINIILNFTMLPKFGYQCAAITTLISFVLYCIIALIFSRKELAIEIDKTSLLKVLLASSLMLIGINLIKKIIIINTAIKLFLLIFIAIIIYAISLILTKEITKKDLNIFIEAIRKNN